MKQATSLSLILKLVSIIILLNIGIPLSLASDTYTINYILTIHPNITAWYNNINGWNQTAMTVNAGNSVTFNITVDQTVTNISWNVSGSEEQNTSSLEFNRLFGSTGNFNVTAQAFNANGSSNIIYTLVTVVSGGGGGTDYDWLDGYVKNELGNPINLAWVNTSQGNTQTASNGYYSFGYVFVDLDSYWINVSKSGYYDNNTYLLFNDDHEVLNVTLTTIPLPNAPIIISYENNYTNNSILTFSVPKYTNVLFNVTANQTIATWTWTGATKESGDGTTDSTASKNFSSSGIQTVSVYGTNINGSTQTITWTITVSLVGNVTVTGYLTNNLEYPLENARVDINNNFTFTDSNGYYELNTTTGNYTVLARAIGYYNSSIVIDFIGNTTLNFTLVERKVAMRAPGFEAIIFILVLGILYIRQKRQNGS